ncbi:hypothetical protein AXE80_02415 [Wenyingzhuangia fucanilytica]|uniref:Spondin domain-containing protein n=1 Tax=Wenyingzhuangia fucanilytica TaxID=1790137 RepID=A0A1B1Y353_9FLAO|nr:hypothetical protein [Wenyingzhuangia fucanilytica]ANW95206.1 hypothetical protein AXE80_02415 [Wenyingzhuangia fucanilytica]
MKNLLNLSKGVFTLAMLAGLSTQAQLIDEKDVTVTMDLQPVLQLDMTTANQIQFIFDDVLDYQAGIVQYAATTLKVSSTVSWDLYAIARSQGNLGATYWDQQVDYGTGTPNNSTNLLPLSLLELRQSRPNNGASIASAGGATYADYSSPFTTYQYTTGATDPTTGVTDPDIAPAGSGANSIYVDPAGGGAIPGPTHKYIAGHSGITASGADSMTGGSYMTATSGVSSDYYYNIDYRILPGLPATFPMAYDATGNNTEALAAGTYAEPGVYTMYVQYVLLEDQ